MAKAPAPGRVKTRLCPPCTPEQAAAIAEAALVDTMRTATASRFDRVVVALDGEPGDWLPDGVHVVPQVAGDFGQRLEAAWSEMRGPALQIGMDTPQLDVEALTAAASALARSAGDAVLGPAADGGWYLLGLHEPVPGAFDGVPMSTSETCAAQRARLEELGVGVLELPTVIDVDEWPDAVTVAAAAPETEFAAAVRQVAETTEART